jgi:hypothetical protein
MLTETGRKCKMSKTLCSFGTSKTRKATPCYPHGEHSVVKLNPLLALVIAGCVPFLLGCKASVVPLAPQPAHAAPSVNAAQVAAQWDYPKKQLSPSTAATTGIAVRSFQADAPLPTVWAYYAKRFGLKQTFAPGVSGTHSSQTLNVAHQVLYQSTETGSLQTAFFTFTDTTMQLTLNLSHIKGSKETLVSIAVRAH